MALRLWHLARSEGQSITPGYDTGGRLSTLTEPRGQTTFAYHPTTGRLSGISAPGGVALSYTYDGILRTETTWNSPVAGSVGRTFDADLRVASESVNGANDIAFQYDPNSLLTQVGSLSLTRHPQHGLLTGTTLGNVTDGLTYNTFGELSTYQASYSGSPQLNTQYTRDALGRITQKVETIGGATTTTLYGYDQAGHLTDVTVGGTLTAHYDYDGNGNRLAVTRPGSGTISGTYDAQDRLMSYGAVSYTYTANGDLQTATSGGEVTTYSYDVFGNLTSVTLPSGTQIEYVVDGQNRRIGKKVNGTLTQSFLYSGQFRTIAELDGTGNLVSRFVYGTKLNVPEYLVKGGTTYRLLTDHLGSVRLVVDIATGTIAQRIDYDEFGQITQDTNPGFQPFGFAGGLYDQHTKLTRFGARDYDAFTGRWTTKDPIRFGGGDTSLYGYLVSDPLNFTDPLGLSSLSFSRGEGRLRIYDRSGDLVGDFPAANNAVNPSADPLIPGGYGPAPTGTFPTGAQVRDKPGGLTGRFGSGILDVYLPPGPTGVPRTGVGIHAGRWQTCDPAGRCGWEHATQGCIRTTEDAMELLRDLIRHGDPPKAITLY